MGEILHDCWVDFMEDFDHLFFNGDIIPHNGLGVSSYSVYMAHTTTKTYSTLTFNIPF